MTLMKKIGIFFVSARLLNVDELSGIMKCTTARSILIDLLLVNEKPYSNPRFFVLSLEFEFLTFLGRMFQSLGA